MLFEKFFRTISSLVPDRWLAADLGALSRLNPDKIYVENVRSVLGTTTARARFICEIAVRQGVFMRRVEVLCPDGSVGASAPIETELPETVHCWLEENGDLREITLATAQLTKTTFYQFHDDAADGPHRHTA